MDIIKNLESLIQSTIFILPRFNNSNPYVMAINAIQGKDLSPQNRENIVEKLRSIADVQLEFSNNSEDAVLTSYHKMVADTMSETANVIETNSSEEKVVNFINRHKNQIKLIEELIDDMTAGIDNRKTDENRRIALQKAWDNKALLTTGRDGLKEAIFEVTPVVSPEDIEAAIEVSVEPEE